MSKRDDDTFIVKAETAFHALPRWLKTKGCNTYSYSARKCINVGYDTKPDSDWGKYTWRGRVVILDPTLFDKTCAAIEKAYGWQSEHAKIIEFPATAEDQKIGDSTSRL